MLPGPLSFRLRAVSSQNDTSSCQCRAFLMAQWARTVSSRTSGVGIQDSAKERVPFLPFRANAALHAALPYLGLLLVFTVWSQLSWHFNQC